MRVLIQNKQRKFEITKDIKSVIEKVILKALELENIKIPVEVSVALMNNTGIRRFNSMYRSINKSTDVLSFPMYEKKVLKDIFNKGAVQTNEFIPLGDILISLEKTEKQAEEYGHAFKRELGYLTAHGILHLLGYDHLKDLERMEMRKREEEILNALELSRQN